MILWDSHPLALGATPQQVWIDGIAQLDTPHIISKPAALQKKPATPNFDKEAEETLKYDGLPPLDPKPSKTRTVVFTNVSAVYLREDDGVSEVYAARTAAGSATPGVVVVRNGKLDCVGAPSSACAFSVTREDDADYIDLEGGAISPGLVSTGSPLGLEEIRSESSTRDGLVLDPLTYVVPEIVGGEGALIRAADGLQFGTRDAL